MRDDNGLPPEHRQEEESDSVLDLPPLEHPRAVQDDKTGVRRHSPEPEPALSLKEFPPEEDSREEPLPVGTAGRKKGKRRPRRRLVLTVLLLAAALWAVLEVGLPRINTERRFPSSATALLTVQTSSDVQVFIDGEPLGNVRDSAVFELKPGLHRILARSPRGEERNFLIEIEAGQTKRIEVHFGP